MEKKRINQYHFQNRTGSHSMTGYAKGYLEVLPVNAEGFIGSNHSLLEQKEILNQEITYLRNLHKEKRLSKKENHRLNSLKGMIGNINHTLLLRSTTREEIKAWVFWRVAQQRLRHEIFKELDMEAETIIIHNENTKL